MKKVIYSKYSNERDQKYSIRTDIVQDESEKYVLKSAATKEAKEHLEKMLEWQDKLNELYRGKDVKLNKCHLSEEGLVFEFIEGKSLEEMLDEYLEQGKIVEIKKAVLEYAELIKSLYHGEIFESSEEFKEVFKDVELPIDLKAGPLTNIDMIFGNLIDNHGWNVIDYEWTFEFLIPVNFVIFRALFYYVYGSSHRSVLIAEDLFRLCGMTDWEKEAYEKMENNFQKYMRGTHKYLSYMYKDMGQPNWSILQLIDGKKELMSKQAIRIYVDNGEGINENASYVIEESLLQTDNIKFEIPVTAFTKLVRIDPASQKCVVKVHQLDGEGLDIYSASYKTNGSKIGKDTYIFQTLDPQIVVSEIKNGTNKLIVHLSVGLLGDQVINEPTRIERLKSGLRKNGLASFSKKAVKKCKMKYLVKRQSAKDARLKEKMYQYLFPTNEESEEQKKTVFSQAIKFSILVPLYNTPQNYLREMIESVLEQTYSDWELCLADGSTSDFSNVGQICLEYSAKDSRIKYKRLEKNLGISENTNECLEMATGDYIGLFDHDDILHPGVLFENAKVIEEQNADFIYSDEATFLGDDRKNITLYHFKPDFSLDNLRANNYICHFSVFKKSLINETGGFNKEFDGSQDHDLILRLTEKAEKIIHIPKILYFWRAHEGSVAAGIDTKTYAIEAGVKAVEASILRAGMKGKASPSLVSKSIYRIEYELEKEPLVSIIIPNKNHLEDLSRCIDSIFVRTTYKNFEIIIMENNSDEEEIFEYYKEFENFENVKVVRWNKPFNYSAINNEGAGRAAGEYLLFLNNDTEVITPNWIQELLMYAQRSDVGAVGAKLYYPDDTIQHAGVIMGIGEHKVAGHSHVGAVKTDPGYMGRMFFSQNVSGVTAACMIVHKNVFWEVDGFEEALEVAYNDVDLCMKIREKGKLIVMNPYAECYHYESVSRGEDDTAEKSERFQKEVEYIRNKWGTVIDNGDPYYNKNLSLQHPWKYEPEVINE